MTQYPGRKDNGVEAPDVQEPAPAEAIAAAGETARKAIANCAQVVQAPADTLERCVLAILCEGHVILEDFPGVGKTMLAKSLARSLDCEFARIQATPDLLPSDVTGVSVFNMRGNDFEFKPGPVFANMVLVDEINRASPKTQSALLECMQEAQVTVDGHSYELARPFMVIATQNPIEFEGTFPLPEAQLDRFAMRLRLGYPELQDEAAMLASHSAGEPLDALRPVATAAEVEAAIAAVRSVFVEESLHRYVVALLRYTRSESRLVLGASPRAGIALLRVAKAHAALRGRDYVIPADVKAVAVDVLSHRVILAADARTSGVETDEVIAEAIERTPVPM
jgi:MoxR-like ATPase